ncbi:adenosylcobinamide kinase/adenosylcobinamide-phosphate guanylyltransferase [Paenibacillus phyllosphaerae]|uniref:Adenosylcobinamide kinase n=1 Tax=Paenibacillus phyllosphaerae TaxID=274593 RepID=A0A7W5AVC9_9BACL|nr:bifunctional adenosylcobinamide kinase/adenosylcobinamide-phosphate guanylyltransferase [Paenibacillus phyllosphaerae]MBB3109489.1 adenosylcobinamide kinase/adenosylcobinamide-phosphate guanylyltransferase [Paenibacillus phyllosphaerae]
MAIFITGGARSGKSDFAERYAMRLGTRGIYIATSQIWDEEMRERVEQHRAIREQSGYSWSTVEEPYRLADCLKELQAQHVSGTERPVVLVDCLTLWLSNHLLLHAPEGEEWDKGTSRELSLQLDRLTDELIDTVAAYDGTLLLVSNEVGSGVVPAYPLGRRFRDAAGRLNRRLAQHCEEAFLVVAGMPLDLKKLAFNLEEL